MNPTCGIWGSSSAGLEHRTVTAKVVGSNPIYPVRVASSEVEHSAFNRPVLRSIRRQPIAVLAQLEEQGFSKAQVVGSSPINGIRVSVRVVNGSGL